MIKHRMRDILYRLGVLLGSALALIGLVLALNGFIPGLLLVLVAIPLVGLRRVAGMANIHF